MRPSLRATNVQPVHATLLYSFNLFNNKIAFWALNGLGFVLLVLYGMLFSRLIPRLRPGVTLELVITNENLLFVLVAMLGATIAVVILHELIHGIFSWIVTRSRPVFGYREGYFYTANPGWYFPRREYVIVALAPFILLTLLGLLLLLLVPPGAITYFLFATILNAAGSIGDFYLIFLVARERRAILIEDVGDGVNFFALS